MDLSAELLQYIVEKDFLEFVICRDLEVGDVVLAQTFVLHQVLVQPDELARGLVLY